jgi:hypothetical protein
MTWVEVILPVFAIALYYNEVMRFQAAKLRQTRLFQPTVLGQSDWNYFFYFSA